MSVAFSSGCGSPLQPILMVLWAQVLACIPFAFQKGLRHWVWVMSEIFMGDLTAVRLCQRAQHKKAGSVSTTDLVAARRWSV